MTNYRSQNIERVQLQPAYILHSRDFRDTSKILDVLTPEFGRLHLLAKGVKQPKSTRRAVLQPFRSLLISWQGRGELSTLTSVEEVGRTLDLNGIQLVCGYYMSELLQRLLTKADSNVELFSCYDKTLRALKHTKNIEGLLRSFEISALRSLGQLPDFDRCVYGELPVESQLLYKYVPELGALPNDAETDYKAIPISGKSLLAIHALEFSDPLVCKEAKNLMRWILLYQIGEKPIRSRELFHVYKDV